MMLYLNHAGTSWPKPEPVQRAAAEALGGSPEQWPASFETHHRAVAAALGIAQAQRLLLTPGCTAALSVAIGDHDWQPGDRIVTSALEHHALLRPVLALRERGVRHVMIPPDGDAPLDLARLEAVLRDGRVRLIAMCAAANVTGALLPIEEVIRLGHSHGARVLLDAAQLAGWVALDVAQLDVDLLAFAGHKGPQAPWGVGGLYVAPQLTMRTPLVRLAAANDRLREGGMGASAEDVAGVLREDAFAAMPDYCDTGSVDRAALAGLVAGLRWLAAPERKDRLSRARELIGRMAEMLQSRRDATLYGPPAPEARMPTLAFNLAERPASEVARALRAQGVFVSGGLQCARLAHETLGTAPHGVVRLSVGPQSPEDAPEQLAEAMSQLPG